MLHRLLNRLRPPPPPSPTLGQQRAAYLETRRPHAYAPHDAALYGALLRQVRERPELELPPFSRAGSDDGARARLYLRHDVDTAACVEKLPMLLDLNLAEGVASPVYIRTDGVDYAPEAISSTVTSYRAKGVEFGLHTSCYTEDDYLGAFRREIARFAECFGFQPATFTVHGLGTFRSDVRGRFTAEIADRLPEFGFEFTDCNVRLRQYDYVVTDCHLEAGTGHRYIYDDIVALPRFFAPGRDHLVLTHPCYWR